MLRTDVADRIDRRVAAAVPALPLFQTLLVYVVRKGLQGVVPNGFGSQLVTATGWTHFVPLCFLYHSCTNVGHWWGVHTSPEVGIPTVPLVSPSPVLLLTLPVAAPKRRVVGGSSLDDLGVLTLMVGRPRESPEPNFRSGHCRACWPSSPVRR